MTYWMLSKKWAWIKNIYQNTYKTNITNCRIMNTDFCSICSEEFIKKTSTQMTCPNKECRKAHQEANKNTKKLHGHLVLIKESIKTSQKEEKLTRTVKNAILNDMTSKVWYTYCEKCWATNKLLELHHAIFRSECPKHPQKHSKINSIILCHSCHEWFHEKKSNRNYLIIERELWNVFDFLKKEYYLNL